MKSDTLLKKKKTSTWEYQTSRKVSHHRARIRRDICSVLRAVGENLKRLSVIITWGHTSPLKNVALAALWRIKTARGLNYRLLWAAR